MLNRWMQLFIGYEGYLRFPWLYVLLALLVLYLYRRTQAVERSAFGVKVTSPLANWGLSLATGLGAGLFATACTALFRVHIDLSDVVCLWVASGLFALWNMRLTCVSYGAGLVTLVQGLALLASTQGLHGAVLNYLLSVHAASLLTLAAILHIAEGLLVYLTGAFDASPLFVQSRRGQIIGAFMLQKFWIAPAVLAGIQGGVLPFPLLIGFSGLATATQPARMVKYTGWLTLVYGIVLLGLCLGADSLGTGFTVVAVLAIALHEVLYYTVRLSEERAAPLFVRPVRGVKVLATLPHSPARKLGLAAGETILKVGGMAVNSPYDIHFALDLNPAYVKIEVADVRGEIRFVGTPVYAGDPHQLGVIVVPDERAREYAQIYELSIGRWLGRLLTSRKRFVAQETSHFS